MVMLEIRPTPGTRSRAVAQRLLAVALLLALTVPLVLIEYGWIVDPWCKGLIDRQMNLGRLCVHIRFPHPCVHA